MSAAPLIGPVDETAVRLREDEPGRLTIDDPATGLVGSGWVEPVGVAGSTAWVRISTAAVDSEVAAAAVDSVLAQVRASGARRLVLEPDDEDDGPIPGPLAPVVDDLDVIIVPPLRVTNSLGRHLERLVPMHPGRVGMYSCGPTVYSFAHLGNMRPYVFADTLKRTLEWRGLRVHHVINITDVGHLLADADQGEDKVEEASRREGRSVEDITGGYTEAFWQDLRELQVREADEWPKASTYVPQMVVFAQVLQDRDYGYVLPDGLYFDTSLQADYGELAGIDTAGQRETGRVETVGKRSLSDFALWRTFTDGRERLMQWDSPWGVGAPGWHLECSVMSMSLLGEHFDIHTGGIDHRALHHVNEIAQSEAYLEDGRPWVRYWMHNEFLRLGGAKMAKSEGGFLRLADLVALGVHPLAYRYLLLQSQYASQLDFTEKLAANAHVALKRLSSRLRGALGPASGRSELSEPVTLAAALDQAAALGSAALRDRLLVLDAAMADDLQTPKVLASLQEWSRRPDDLEPAAWEVLVRAANTLTGLRFGQLGVADFAPPLPDDVDVEWVEDLVAERDAARAARDWETADRMRAELAGAGIKVEDTPAGSHWHWAGAP